MTQTLRSAGEVVAIIPGVCHERAPQVVGSPFDPDTLQTGTPPPPETTCTAIGLMRFVQSGAVIINRNTQETLAAIQERAAQEERSRQ